MNSTCRLSIFVLLLTTQVPLLAAQIVFPNIKLTPVEVPDQLEIKKKQLELQQLQLQIEEQKQRIEAQKRQAAGAATPSSAVSQPKPASDPNARQPERPGGSLESIQRQCDESGGINVPNALEYGQCLGYISGILQTLNTAKIICVPEAVTLNQAVKVIQKWANDHPANLHEPAVQHVEAALATSFACPPK